MREPHFWRGDIDPKSRAAAPLTRLLLTPFAALYSWAGARRIRTTTAYDCGIPVICIGNLTVGGSGKTPIVRELRRILNERGFRAAALSRGYRGRLNGPLRVDRDHHTAADVGDEPRMLAEDGEVWIGSDRPAVARAMRNDGVDLIIMDDGHQNPTLMKTLNLVVVDAGQPFGNGHVFPKGPLREPVARGLRRADAVILSGDGDVDLGRFAGPVLRANTLPEALTSDIDYVAFAGIGRPDKFFDTLGRLTKRIEETVPYPDHHPYSDRDIAWLRKLADERNARLITTEKDLIRLSPDQARDIDVLRIRASLSPVRRLDELLAKALGPQRHG